MSKPIDFDFLVVGAGIAGASAAYALAAEATVAVLERETAPGYHATGRSAAIFSTVYGAGAVRTLTKASRAFFENPPEEFAERPLLDCIGLVEYGAPGEEEAIAALFEDHAQVDQSVRLVDEAEISRLAPFFKPGAATAGVFEPNACKIDVAALHQGYLKHAKRRGGALAMRSLVTALAYDGGAWMVTTEDETYRAPVVIDAAGAWADEVAALAGAAPLGLTPRRRTVVAIDPPAGVAVDETPGLVRAAGGFFLFPDAGRLLISPAEETPVPPQDARPEEIDIATAIDRFEEATGREVAATVQEWAGLRTFAPDEQPVIGFDPAVPGFFWLAGQGGSGIQTAPAASELAAALLLGREVPAALAQLGLTAETLSPARFAA